MPEIEETQLTNMCRLCSSQENLVWVFDKRFENSMKYVIFVTTGVQIHTTDAVSQKICEKCCHVTINMFEFRKTSLKNDKHLKEQLQKLKDDNDAAPLPPRMLPSVTIKEEKIDTVEDSNQNSGKDSPDIHPTVKELYTLHPHLKLPRVCLKLDVKPMVMMKMDEVEEHFNQRQLDFKEHCRLVLKQKHTARKKTSGSFPRARSSYLESPPCLISGQIIPQDEEGADKGVLRPIKIKIIPKIPAGESIPEGIKELEPVTITQCHEKEKPSNIEGSLSKESDMPEEVGQSTKFQSEVVEPLSCVTNVSVPLLICNICDSVHYSTKDLKKHRYKHLRCKFCRTTFRTMESKTEHVESECLVKKAINNFPCVEVRRIETDMDVVKKYRKAFVAEFPSIAAAEENLEVLCISSESDKESSSKPTNEVAPDIIEILSDDDDGIQKPSARIPTITPPIKPNVKIKDNPLMDCINSNEMDTLKNLLSYHKPLPLSSEKGIQTDAPFSPIEVDENNLSAVFMDLKHHLHSFRVPVDIKNGTSFEVSYSYSKEPVRHKNLQLWNDLTPVDIKINETKNLAATPATGTVIKGGSSTLVQDKPTVEVIKEMVHVNSCANIQPKDIIPMITACDTSSVTNCSSASDSSSSIKPASSTHSRAFVVGSSAVSTFPSGNTDISPPLPTTNKQTVDSTPSSGHSSTPGDCADPAPKRMRISPPPVTTNNTVIAVQDKPMDNTSISSVAPVPVSSSQSYSLLRNVLLPSTSVMTTATATCVSNPIPCPVITPCPTSSSNSSVIVTRKPRRSKKPISFKIPPVPRPTLNTGNVFKDPHHADGPSQPTVSRTERPQSRNGNASTRSQTSFINSKASTSSMNNSVGYPVPLLPNKSIRMARISSSLNNPIAICSTVTVGNTYWPGSYESASLPTTQSVGYSNVPVLVTNNNVATSQTYPSQTNPPPRRSSVPIPQHPYAHHEPKRPRSVPQATVTNNSHVSCAPPVPIYSNDELRNRSSVPAQYQIQPPSYSESLYVNTSSTRRAAQNPRNGNTFLNPVPQACSSQASQSVGYPSTYSISSQMINENNNYYQRGRCYSTAPSVLNTSQSSTRSTLSTYVSQTPDDFIPQMNSAQTNSCSMGSLTATNFGQIRVKNLRELT